MSSTNSTPNYNLSQFIGADKPSWLTDINSDMGKIDTALKANNTLAQTGVDNASTADTKATNAQADATQALQDASVAQSTANSAGTKADYANSKIEKFNLTNHASITAQQIYYYVNNVQQSSNGISNLNLNVATNSDGSIFKVYGYIQLSAPTATTTGEWRFASNIRPSSEITINSAGIRANTTSSYVVTTVSSLSLKIQTDGTVVISGVRQLNESSFFYLPPCLYFGVDFGDQA